MDSDTYMIWYKKKIHKKNLIQIKYESILHIYIYKI